MAAGVTAAGVMAAGARIMVVAIVFILGILATTATDSIIATTVTDAMDPYVALYY